MKQRLWAYCPLTQEVKTKLLRQIDRGAWKHSWHLPMTDYSIDWDCAETITAIRDVLVDQATAARQQLADAEALLIPVANAMINMEQDAKDDNEEN